MAAECLSAIHLCRIRATRLDSVGNPEAGPNNVYVSDKPIQVAVTPQIQAGTDSTLVGGCDCIVAQYRGYDKLKYFTLELDLGKVEPGLKEMLLGADAILDSGGDPIGNWWPAAQLFDCSTTPSPNVCFEAWQDAWEDDHQAASPHRFIHWIWPSTYWQIAAHTLANDFYQPKLTAFTRGNTAWGEGIFGDLPEAAEAFGGYFYADEIPDAECGYQSFAIT
jgi:hypothetical protein